jgi:hypothetical protein
MRVSLFVAAKVQRTPPTLFSVQIGNPPVIDLATAPAELKPFVLEATLDEFIEDEHRHRR